MNEKGLYVGLVRDETPAENRARRIRELEQRATQLEAELKVVRERIEQLRRGEDPT